MKRVLSLSLLMALVTGCATASTLTLSGNTPTHLNDGTCSARVLLAATSPIRTHFKATGAVTREDSTAAMAPGSPFTLVLTLPAGPYTALVWSTNAAGASCDTTFSVTALAPPATPVVHSP